MKPTPDSAYGAPSRGRYQRPGKAGSAVSLALGCAGFMRRESCDHLEGH